MARWSTHVNLFLLLIGQISAVPQHDAPVRDVRKAACQDQKKLNDRLDAVEKRVEGTVQKLETELAELLDALEGPEWSFIHNGGTTGHAVDILDESNSSSRQRGEKTVV